MRTPSRKGRPTVISHDRRPLPRLSLGCRPGGAHPRDLQGFARFCADFEIPGREELLGLLPGQRDLILEFTHPQETRMLCSMVLLGSGIVYAFLESTPEGKIVLLTLFVGSIFSWSVMITKIRVLSFAKKQSERFMALFHRDREPLSIFETGLEFEGSPLYEIYEAGCEELCFQVLGSTEVDETFKSRLKFADRITPAQMRSVQAAMERAVGEASLKLESQMIILSTAVSGAPFIGLLGTVWGVMDAFGGIAASGSASLAAMAPGVSGALITTVTGLLVAIPAMFGYNFLVTSVRGMIVQCDNFAAELSSEIEHRYVSHGGRG